MMAASFHAVLDGVDQVESLRGAQALRSLAERGEQVGALLEVAAASADALHEVPDVADALDRLANHRDTLERLVELAELADNVERLARAMRVVRGHRDELEWAASEDWSADEEA
ncbi:MAG: hypothetical protein GY719_13520 [bacterium]|nr:hypothetical protein [bacterium]